MEDYFTYPLLHKESNKEVKESLPDNVDSDNEADSESEDDASATLIFEPMVAYLDNPDCNNPAKMKVSGFLMKMLPLIIPCVWRCI